MAEGWTTWWCTPHPSSESIEPWLRNHVADEVVVRTSICADEDLVSAAVMLWANACDRRTAQRQLRQSRADEADSSSEGFSASESDSGSQTEGSSSREMGSDSFSNSSANEGSQGSSSAASVSVKAPEPVPREEKEEVVAEEVAYICPWFQKFVATNPILNRFLPILRQEGFDSKQTFPFLTVEDMARLGFPPGVRRLLDDAKRQIGESASSTR